MGKKPFFIAQKYFAKWETNNSLSETYKVFFDKTASQFPYYPIPLYYNNAR